MVFVWHVATYSLYRTPSECLRCLNRKCCSKVYFQNCGYPLSVQTCLSLSSVSRDDLLLIGPGNKNYTYVAQAVNRGVTLIGLWDRRHPGMADYIPVAVEHAIEPDTQLTFVGDVICFSTHLVNQHGLYIFPFSTSQLIINSGDFKVMNFLEDFFFPKSL